MVDVDDPDEVVDLVIERVLSLTIDEGVPVHVPPVRTHGLAGSAQRPDSCRAVTTRLPASQPFLPARRLPARSALLHYCCRGAAPVWQ
jgi:hypothetical protein